MTSIGAIWHVWRREDMGKLTEFLKRPDVRAMTPYMYVQSLAVGGRLGA